MGSGGGQLRFGSLATINFEVFSELTRILPQEHWASNARLSLRVANVTNRRQRVTDSFDATPVNYQPAYLDPVGRTVVLELRKVF